MGLDINETKFVNKVKERLKLKLETIREIKFTILSIFLIFLPTYTKEKKEGRSSVLIIIVFWSLFYILLLNNQHSLVGSRNKPNKSIQLWSIWILLLYVAYLSHYAGCDHCFRVTRKVLALSGVSWPWLPKQLLGFPPPLLGSVYFLF